MTPVTVVADRNKVCDRLRSYGNQPLDRTWFYLLRSSAIAIAGSQTIAEVVSIRSQTLLRSAIIWKPAFSCNFSCRGENKNVQLETLSAYGKPCVRSLSPWRKILGTAPVILAILCSFFAVIAALVWYSNLFPQGAQDYIQNHDLNRAGPVVISILGFIAVCCVSWSYTITCTTFARIKQAALHFYFFKSIKINCILLPNLTLNYTHLI